MKGYKYLEFFFSLSDTFMTYEVLSQKREQATLNDMRDKRENLG